MIASTKDLIEEASNYSKTKMSVTTNENGNEFNYKTSSIPSSMILRGHSLSMSVWVWGVFKYANYVTSTGA